MFYLCLLHIETVFFGALFGNPVFGMLFREVFAMPTKFFEDYGQGLSYGTGLLGYSRDTAHFHLHPHYELMVVPDPVLLDHVICGEHIKTDYPCAVLVSPFIPHFSHCVLLEETGRYPRDLWYFGSVVLHSMRSGDVLNELLGSGVSSIINISSRVGAIRRLIYAYNGLTPESPERFNLLEIILGLVREAVSPSKSRENRRSIANHMENYIVEVISYITDHLSEKITTETLAKTFFVSPDKLRKDFKRCTYVNIGEFIQRMRLNYARELLADRKYSVSDIVNLCGYESESYFYKLFRSVTGQTPLEYKKNAH